jgi:hypothetical protein
MTDSFIQPFPVTEWQRRKFLMVNCRCRRIPCQDDDETEATFGTDRILKPTVDRDDGMVFISSSVTLTMGDNPGRLDAKEWRFKPNRQVGHIWLCVLAPPIL